jgi:hypothetical protein
MLLAEVHSKGMEEARNHEDYLTSAVFGHLRYIPPGTFWDALFSRAIGLNSGQSQKRTLSQAVAEYGRPIHAYDRLVAHFWPRHAASGEPDLLLSFSAVDARSLLVLIEAKLWAGKSGAGEKDQLAKYLRLLDDLPGFGLDFPADSLSFLVYLTPRNSLHELEESMSGPLSRPDDRLRVFRLRWQDIVSAVKVEHQPAVEPQATILNDVTHFLRRLGLEYFDGFHRVSDLPDIEPRPLPLMGTARGHFRGFAELPDLPDVEARPWGVHR